MRDGEAVLPDARPLFLLRLPPSPLGCPGAGCHRSEPAGAGSRRRHPGPDFAGWAQAADRHSDGGGGLLRRAPRFNYEGGAPFSGLR